MIAEVFGAANIPEPIPVPANVAAHIAALPPASSLFAAFLGANPLQPLLAPSGVLSHLTEARRRTLTGTSFFPHLIAGAFHQGLVVVFALATILSLFGAVASVLRGSRRERAPFAPPPVEGA